ncbi:MAG TPA: HAMP domain-containing histidine kinase [Mollicutes bacterium]|nr:HAMP domain-containing histidine kinase [Mollicutes bacterium]
MKNKIELKKYLFATLIIFVVFVSVFNVLYAYQYNTYTKNYNNKLNSIINKIEKKYPNITAKEILEILNNDKKVEDSLSKFGITELDSAILENESNYKNFIMINSITISLFVLILVLFFIKYNIKKYKDINEITKCIENINNKVYELHIDKNSEDELSILKNEIYKTTIMLKEEAENSKKDKLELKDSLSNISHQLKTPLTSILIIIDNLIDTSEMNYSMREEFLRDIKREITNINFLVGSLLKIAKLDTNTVNFIEEDVKLKKIVEESIKNVSVLSDLKNVDIKINIINDSIIRCDFKWQIEAITNILKNCVEHSKEDSKIEITISDNKIYSLMEIKDNGVGIDKEDINHIFQRFYKGKNSSNDSIGIGLSLAKTIIDKSNGSINVESGKSGTKFVIKYFK